MWLLLILIALTVLVTLGLGLHLVENLESENRMAEARLHAAQMYDEALEVRAKEMRRFRHDVNGLLQAIEHESKNRSAEDSSGQSRVVDAVDDSAISLVNALLEHKRAQCRDAGIDFTSDIDTGWRAFAQDRGIAESDIQAVIQNLLQNAYEASLEVFPESDRLIRLSLDDCEGRLRIETTNRIVSDEVPTFETTKDDPEQHGIGLAVIKDIVASYDGSKDALFDSKTRLLTMCVIL